MGTFTSSLALMGMGMQAYGQYQSGQAAQAAAEYNAQIYQQQAQVIETKRGITAEQYDRMIRKLEGATMSAVASSGYDFSGSFLSVMNDTLTQAELDKQMADYNLAVEKVLMLSKADESRRQGQMAKTQATVGAISTLLTGGNDWYQKYGGFGKRTTTDGTGGLSWSDH